MKVLVISDIHGSSYYAKKIKEININGYNVFLTHGHKYNMDRLPPLGIKMDIMMYGHFHEGFIIEENGIIFANPGSISLPRGNSKHSYLIFTDKELILKDVDGNIIKQMELPPRL